MRSATPLSPTTASKKVEFAYDYMHRRIQKKVFDRTGSAWSATPSTRLKAQISRLKSLPLPTVSRPKTHDSRLSRPPPSNAVAALLSCSAGHFGSTNPLISHNEQTSNVHFPFPASHSPAPPAACSTLGESVNNRFSFENVRMSWIAVGTAAR